MNLRTITFWAVYDTERRVIIRMKRFKRMLPKIRKGDVAVKMKGHYMPPHVTRET